MAKTKAQPKVTKFSDKLTDSLEDITGMVNEHKDMIDAIQEISLDLTELLDNLHEWAIKYSGIANQVLDVLLPILEKMPIVPKKMTALLDDLEEYTQKLLDSQESTSKTLKNVQNGLRTGNVDKIKGETTDLKKAAAIIKNILPG